MARKRFAQVPLEILELMAGGSLTRNATRVLAFVIRWTIGQKSDFSRWVRITNDEISTGRRGATKGTRRCPGTGIAKNRIPAAVKELLDAGLLEVERDASDKAREKRFVRIPRQWFETDPGVTKPSSLEVTERECLNDTVDYEAVTPNAFRVKDLEKRIEGEVAKDDDFSDLFPVSSSSPDQQPGGTAEERLKRLRGEYGGDPLAVVQRIIAARVRNRLESTHLLDRLAVIWWVHIGVDPVKVDDDEWYTLTSGLAATCPRMYELDDEQTIQAFKAMLQDSEWHVENVWKRRRAEAPTKGKAGQSWKEKWDRQALAIATALTPEREQELQARLENPQPLDDDRVQAWRRAYEWDSGGKAAPVDWNEQQWKDWLTEEARVERLRTAAYEGSFVAWENQAQQERYASQVWKISEYEASARLAEMAKSKTGNALQKLAVSKADIDRSAGIN